MRTSPTTRLRALAASVAVGLLAGLGLAGSPLPARAATPTGVASLAVPAASGQVNDGGASGVLLAALPATDVDTFTEAALSWARGGSTDVTVQVRTRAKGTWSGWTTLELTKSDRGRVGTELPFLGASDGVEARIVGQPGAAVSDVTLTLIDTNTLPSVSGPEPTVNPPATAMNATKTDQVVSDVPAPANIITREQWGANPAYWNTMDDPECAYPLWNVQGAVVHHTAGSNDYTAAESAGIVRGIYYYHAVTLGWCDIGYNFLVDKYGQIFQGRVGEMGMATWGAHATYVNSRSIGVSLLGTTDSLYPSQAAVSSIADIIAWRFGRYDILPSDTARYSNNGTPVDAPAIQGHGLLPYFSTGCPGSGLRSEMGTIRTKVASRLKRYKLTFDELPDILPAGRQLTLSGAVTGGVAGQRISFDATLPDGTFKPDVATAVIGDNTLYSTTWTVPAGVDGSVTLAARMNVAGAGNLYAEQYVTAAPEITLVQPAQPSLNGTMNLQGWIAPAEADVWVSFYGYAASDGRALYELGWTTTDANGYFSFNTNWAAGNASQLEIFAQASIQGQITNSNHVYTQRGTTGTGLTINVDGPVPLVDDQHIWGMTKPATGGAPITLYGRLAPGGDVITLGTTTSADDGSWSYYSSFGNNQTTPYELWAVAKINGVTVTSPTTTVTRVMYRVVMDQPNATEMDKPITLTGRTVPAGNNVPVTIWGQPEQGQPAVLLGTTTTDSNGEYRFTTAFGTGQPTPSRYWAQVYAGGGRYEKSPVVESQRVGTPYTVGNGSVYRALTPERILDTRTGLGARGPVSPFGTVNLKVAGVGKVPATASAVVLSVTATNVSSAGFVTAYPGGMGRPGSSNLNFVAGNTVAGLVTVPVGDDGSVNLYLGSAGTGQLVADVAGYYLPTNGKPAGSLIPTQPTRVMDTRTGLGGGRFGAGTTRTLQVGGTAGMPTTGVSAVALNVTVTEPTSAGHVDLFPTGTARPTVSNVNFVAGQTVANMATVKVGPGGAVDLTMITQGAGHVIVDVVGYYIDGTPTIAGAFVPVNPARTLDTRTGLGFGPAMAPFQTRTLTLAGKGGVPASGAGAVMVNATVTEPTQPGYVRLSPTGATPPVSSNVNFGAGETVANAAIATLGNGSTDVYHHSAGTSHVIADVFGYFIG